MRYRGVEHRRTFALAVAFVLASVLLAMLAVAWKRHEHLALGRRLFGHWHGFGKRVAALQEKSPEVIWLGDSTVAAVPGIDAYPDLLAGDYRARGLAAPGVVSLLGLDFFHAWCMLEPVLEAQPRVVVLTAHLRMLRPSAGTERLLDLCSHLPQQEMLRGMGLPFERRGVGPLDLLGWQLLKTRRGVEVRDLLQGLRHDMQQRLPGHGLISGPSPLQELAVAEDRLSEEERFREYDLAVTTGMPTLEMLAAVIGRVRAAGAIPLVVGAPIPVEALRGRGIYRPEAFDVIGSVVEGAGGNWLDLHDALPPEGFRDASGHYSAAGNQRMAERVGARAAALAAGARSPVRE